MLHCVVAFARLRYGRSIVPLLEINLVSNEAAETSEKGHGEDDVRTNSKGVGGEAFPKRGETFHSCNLVDCIGSTAVKRAATSNGVDGLAVQTRPNHVNAIDCENGGERAG